METKNTQTNGKGDSVFKSLHIHLLVCSKQTFKKKKKKKKNRTHQYRIDGSEKKNQELHCPLLHYINFVEDSECPDQTARMRRRIWAFAVPHLPYYMFSLDAAKEKNEDNDKKEKKSNRKIPKFSYYRNCTDKTSLRKHAYSNILKILPSKYENFQIKKSDIFHVSAQNIDCGYSLEPPRRGGSNGYPHFMF